MLAPLEQHEIERLLGAEVLVDQLLDLAQQLAVLEDRSWTSKIAASSGPACFSARARTWRSRSLALFERRVEALDLAAESLRRE